MPQKKFVLPPEMLLKIVVAAFAIAPIKKGTAFALSVLAGICTAIALFSPYPTMAWFFVAPAALFYLIWQAKEKRDNNIIAEAERERQHAPAQPQLPPIENSQTYDLFIPEPLDK